MVRGCVPGELTRASWGASGRPHLARLSVCVERVRERTAGVKVEAWRRRLTVQPRVERPYVVGYSSCVSIMLHASSALARCVQWVASAERPYMYADGAELANCQDLCLGISYQYAPCHHPAD